MDLQLDAFISKHRPWLLAEARRICGDHIHAEDLVQESFTRFLSHCEAHPILLNEGACVKWLLVTLSNLFFDQCRKQRSHAGAEPELVRFAELQQVEAEPVLRPQRAYELVTEEQLTAAFQALGPRTRAAYELHAQGRSNKEISEQLGIHTGTVGKRLHDARVKLRKMFNVLIPGEN